MPNYFLLHSLLDLARAALQGGMVFVDRLKSEEENALIKDELKDLEALLQDAITLIQDIKDKLSEDQ